MQYRAYGKGGPEISRLGFGAMRLPQRQGGGWGSVNFTKSVEVIRAAMEAGVNLLDSHHRYHEGNSELAIGKALKGWKGQRIYVQTKTPWYKKEPRRYFEKLLDEALQKTGVGCIDYLLHHSMDMEMFKNRGREFIRFTDWAMKRGLIRHRGFSSHDTPKNIRKFIDTGEFSVMLVSYNWMKREDQDVIAYAAKKGMGVTIMNPIQGGTLATTTPQVLRLLPGAKSAAEIALRYVLATPGVTGTLSGMNTLAQVHENTAVAGRAEPMTPRQWKAMQDRIKLSEKAAKNACTACGYCMPCPHGVDIPANLRIVNQIRFFGRIQYANHLYGRLRRAKPADKSAGVCKKCGKCEPKCPNDVHIIRDLRELSKSMEKK